MQTVNRQRLTNSLRLSFQFWRNSILSIAMRTLTNLCLSAWAKLKNSCFTSARPEITCISKEKRKLKKKKSPSKYKEQTKRSKKTKKLSKKKDKNCWNNKKQRPTKSKTIWSLASETCLDLTKQTSNLKPRLLTFVTSRQKMKKNTLVLNCSQSCRKSRERSNKEK